MSVRTYLWTIVIALVIITILLLPRETKEEKLFFNETFEYKLARSLVGFRFGTCWEFARFWEKATGKKCIKIKSYYYNHYICPVVDDIWVDSNYFLDKKVRLFRKK